MHTIRTLGDPVLTAPCAPVAPGDPDLANELTALHVALARFQIEHGFGRAIAGPQLGIAKRCIALNLGATPFAVINPRITWRSDDLMEVWDDCLSIPDLVVRVQRHRSISLAYDDEQGRRRVWDRLPESMSELLQHEIDHLDGILMTDRAHGDDAIRPVAEHATLVGPTRPRHRLSLDAIARASETLDPVFAKTPQFDCEPLSATLGCHLTLKLETANPIRCFKGRGADIFLQQVIAQNDERPLVCGSAGNFGQAMAYACRKHGRSLTVYASTRANPQKIERMQALGATVVLTGDDFDAAKAAARELCQRDGGWMVEDGLEPAISEGAGTIGVELLALGAALDAVVLPLGNGALLNGVARWLKAASPATRVYGVCSTGADAMERSWRSGTLVETQTVDTVADGIAVRVPIAQAVDDMQGLVDDVLLVDDDSIRRAMGQLFDLAGLVVEPAGAAGVAAILQHPERFAGQRVATVLCGSNVEPRVLADGFLAPS